MTDTVTRLNAALEGRYRIERELGEGGMATVYLADDLRHERKIALKVLKPELAAVVGGERFLAEIKTTANLQHPHILPLFDSGEEDGFLFYVMPYVEGETLQDRIDREKQLPVDEAIGIAVAIASALAYAHDHGVVHRDIKPANIMMQAGQPVVGDFGIALAVGSAGGARLTETGLSVGTPFYMSPEQATGDQLVGPAADIYALGAVLYELLSGDPPYTGSTAQAVLGKIIQGVPVSATAVRPSIPVNVDAAIRKALEKLPADRFTSADDFAKALGNPGFRHGASPDAMVAGAGARRWKIGTLVASAVAVLLAGTTFTALNRPEPVRPVERFAVPFFESQAPEFVGGAGFELSPDGSMLVYRHDPGTGQVLYMRRWDELTATAVRDTEEAADPAVSHDGTDLAFSQDGEIKVLALAGGPVRTLTRADQPEWGRDGFIYASTPSGLVRVPRTGGAVEVVTQVNEGDEEHFFGDLLPDGRSAVILVEAAAGAVQVRLLDLETGEMITLVEDAASQRPRYLAPGILVYTSAGQDRSLMASRLDPESRALTGTPVPVLDDVFYWSFADDGKLFYSQIGLGSSVTLQLTWVDRTGQASAVDPDWTFDRGSDVNQGWAVSPDGSMVTLREFTNSGYDIWVKQLPDGPRTRLTFDEADEKMPVWHPNGTDVTFLSTRNGNHDVWTKRADGTQEAELVVDLDADIATVEWSPDGEWLFMRTSSGTFAGSTRNIMALRPGVDSAAAPLLAADYNQLSPSVSPNGEWIAYASNETGRFEVYVRPFPDMSRGRWQVSIDGGRAPQWARNGREIFFQSPEMDMMVVEVETDPVFRADSPQRLFDADPDWLFDTRLYGVFYDAAPDDQRFLVAAEVNQSGTGQDELPSVVLVNNFLEELRRLLPE